MKEIFKLLAVFAVIAAAFVAVFMLLDERARKNGSNRIALLKSKLQAPFGGGKKDFDDIIAEAESSIADYRYCDDEDEDIEVSVEEIVEDIIEDVVEDDDDTVIILSEDDIDSLLDN